MSPDDIVASSGVVLFTTPGCPHCPMVRERIRTTADASLSDNFAEISVPERSDLVDALGVRAAPTTVSFLDGVEKARVVGPASTREISELFERAHSAQAPRHGTIASETRLIRAGAGAALVLAGLVAQVPWLILFGVALIVAGLHDLIPRRSSPAHRRSNGQTVS